ncbi:MAG: S-layer homology domain-containing protein [Clostridia bacterium]|nr:S-layer homology domain-containing protein [Clostridia bacterium]
MYKKLLYLCFVITLFLSMNMASLSGSSAGNSFSDVGSNYAWAQEAIDDLVGRGVLAGMDGEHFAPASPVTKEQFAKMLVLALEIDLVEGVSSDYRDVADNRWSKDYINTAKNYMFDDSYGSASFNPSENYSREKCAYAIAQALGIGADKNLLDKNVLTNHFSDVDDVTSAIRTPMAIVAERAIVRGDGGKLRPKGDVTRAEAAVLLHRAIQYKSRNSQDLFITRTPILGESQISVEQAKRWAEKMGAHQRFIDIADSYWKYGEITGVRPEILYAQAAKETGYGKYTGQVKPEQNNWAGIKIKGATGDKPEDHETFASPDDGVRAHFNHISAYIGTEPVGEPHARYYVLNTMPWRGTVVYTEQLGGKWAPDVTYGYNIAVKILPSMMNAR